MKDKIECWDCNHEFEYCDDDVYEACDIIQGDFVTWTAVRCPKCEIENKVY